MLQHDDDNMMVLMTAMMIVVIISGLLQLSLAAYLMYSRRRLLIALVLQTSTAARSQTRIIDLTLSCELLEAVGEEEPAHSNDGTTASTAADLQTAAGKRAHRQSHKNADWTLPAPLRTRTP